MKTMSEKPEQMPDNVTDRPLVTFALFAYNQEQFIREAVEGAFKQTYEPLEIILSDDCSTDRTFEIMQEMADAYRGPHQVVVNRNHVNLNIGAHVAKVFDMASGEIIIAAAGDDVSAPQRSSFIFEAARAHPDAMAFCSAYRVLGTEKVVQADPPNSVNELLMRRRWIIGATAAYRAELAREFPSIASDVRNEDEVFALRALLRGRIKNVAHDPLVNYRTGIGVSAENNRAYNPKLYKTPSIRELQFRANMIRQWTRDLVHARQGAARLGMYEFRLSNAYLFALATRRRTWGLFKIYRHTFGTRAAIYHFLGHRFPRPLNAYLRVRYRYYSLK